MKKFLNLLILFLTGFYPLTPLAQNVSDEYGYGDDAPFKAPVFKPSDIDFSISDQYKNAGKSTKSTSYKKIPSTPPKSISSYRKDSAPPTKKPPITYKKTATTNAPKSMQKDYKNQMMARPPTKKITPSNNPNAKRIEYDYSKLPANISKKYGAVKIAFKPSAQITRRVRKAVIVIDPGHGGKDPGASGSGGTREKDITLSYSLALKKELERTGRYRVILTRSGDKYVELNNRVKIARRARGDVMISVHADSNPNKNTRGFSIYTISKRRALREAQKLLKKADYEEVVRGVQLKGESWDVKEAIIDFAQKETKDVSDEFSKILAKHLGKQAKPLKRTNREASLAVLTGADIPSVLLELGYLSNRYEERLLRKVTHRDALVRSITSAIGEYFSTYEYLLE